MTKRDTHAEPGWDAPPIAQAKHWVSRIAAPHAAVPTEELAELLGHIRGRLEPVATLEESVNALLTPAVRTVGWIIAREVLLHEDPMLLYASQRALDTLWFLPLEADGLAGDIERFQQYLDDNQADFVQSGQTEARFDGAFLHYLDPIYPHLDPDKRREALALIQSAFGLIGSACRVPASLPGLPSSVLKTISSPGLAYELLTHDLACVDCSTRTGNLFSTLALAIFVSKDAASEALEPVRESLRRMCQAAGVADYHSWAEVFTKDTPDPGRPSYFRVLGQSWRPDLDQALKDCAEVRQRCWGRFRMAQRLERIFMAQSDPGPRRADEVKALLEDGFSKMLGVIATTTPRTVTERPYEKLKVSLLAYAKGIISQEPGISDKELMERCGHEPKTLYKKRGRWPLLHEQLKDHRESLRRSAARDRQEDQERCGVVVPGDLGG